MKLPFNVKMRTAFLAMLCLVRLGFAPQPVSAQTCSVYCPDGSSVIQSCDSNYDPCSSSGGSDSSSGGGYTGPNIWNLLKKSGPSAADRAGQQARAANEQGVRAYNNGDWATAITYFQQALQNHPDYPVYRQNLANAQANQANQQAREKAERDATERQRQNKLAADNMQQSIQNFTQTLSASPTTGGLDFDGSTSGNVPTASTDAGLDFTASIQPSGDPMVVDAGNVPSGLTKDLDNAIATAYANSPPGVSERVAKGFQAVMSKDWNVAHAWFQDALNRDPGNEGIKRMAALTDTSRQTSRQASPVDDRNEPNNLQLPDQDDIYMLFPGLEQPSPIPEPAGSTTTDVYIHNPAKGYKRVTREEAMMMEIFDDMYGVPHLKQIPVNNLNHPMGTP